MSGAAGGSGPLAELCNVIAALDAVGDLIHLGPEAIDALRCELLDRRETARQAAIRAIGGAR